MPVPDRLLRAVLGVLCVVSGAALLRQIALPPWPRASMPSPSALPLPAGYRLKELGVGAGERQREWARSGTRRFAIVPDAPSPGAATGSSLELDLTRLVARRPDGLQVAELTRADPGLSLRHRRLFTESGQEVALGWIDHQPTLQACLVPGGRSGITSSTLGAITGAPPRDLIDRLQRLLGVRPHRSYECVLLSLRDTSGQADHRRVLAVWSDWR